MVTKTLILTGVMSPEQRHLELEKCLVDAEMKSITLVGLGFHDHDENNDTTLSMLTDVLLRSRQWNTVKLSACRGRLDLLLVAILSSKIRRLMISSSPDAPAASAEETRRIIPTLSQGLVTNKTILTLTLNGVTFQPVHMEILSCAMHYNSSLLEVSFAKCTFLKGASAELAKQLPQFKRIQRLGFQRCGMSDEDCANILEGIKGNSQLHELSLDGNMCHHKGIQALSGILSSPGSFLMFLDLSSQKLKDDQTIDLTDLSQALSSSSCRLRCLQLSDNRFDELGMQSLMHALRHNTSLRLLHLAWCRLSETSMAKLGESLISNASLAKLVLYECEMNAKGAKSFVSYLPQMKGLKKVDLGRVRQFYDCDNDCENDDTTTALSKLTQSLEQNYELEEIQVSAPSREDELLRLQFYCDANRCGRRFLRHEDYSPAALWPLILARAQGIHLPSVTTTLPITGLAPTPPTTSQEKIDSLRGQENTAASRRASAMYFLIRNGVQLKMTPS